MTKNCIAQVLKLQQDNETFADLTVEQLLYACVAAVGLDETVAVLATTPWKKYCKGERYNGKNKYGTKLQGIIVKNSKGTREIDFLETPYEHRVEAVLRYL